MHDTLRIGSPAVTWALFRRWWGTKPPRLLHSSRAFKSPSRAGSLLEVPEVGEAGVAGVARVVTTAAVVVVATVVVGTVGTRTHWRFITM